MTQEENDLKDMYYLRMIRAESALRAFIEGFLSVDRAAKVIEQAEADIKLHVAKYPDQ